ncbi:MAG: biopolymer transporter ExbD [bacterium]
MSSNIHDYDDIEDLAVQEVNVTPLADVSLTLLIIMMILTPMVMQAMITVNANKARSVAVPKTMQVSRPISIDIGENVIFLNNELLEDEDIFVTKLKKLIYMDPNSSVLITVSPAVKHGRVVKILDLAKINGAQKLSIVPRKKI